MIQKRAFKPCSGLLDLTVWHRRQAIYAKREIRTPRRLYPWRKPYDVERDLIFSTRRLKQED